MAEFFIRARARSRARESIVSMKKINWKAHIKNTLILEIDDEPSREFHTCIIGKKPRIPASLTDLEAMEYEGARRYALNALSRKSYTSSALKKRLLDRLVDELIADRIISYCQNQGYINDTAWAELFIKGQLARKKSARFILAKLYQKGISPDLAHGLLSQFDEPEGAKLRITELIQNRYKRHDLEDFKGRQKVIASLVRKGFLLEDILECLNKINIVR